VASDQQLIPQPAGMHGFLELQAMRDHSSGVSHSRMGESESETESFCLTACCAWASLIRVIRAETKLVSAGGHGGETVFWGTSILQDMRALQASTM
jgi:hypothetical protein